RRDLTAGQRRWTSGVSGGARMAGHSGRGSFGEGSARYGGGRPDVSRRGGRPDVSRRWSPAGTPHGTARPPYSFPPLARDSPRLPAASLQLSPARARLPADSPKGVLQSLMPEIG